MMHRERIFAVLNRKVPDRLPREIKLTDPLWETFHRVTGAEDVAEHFDLEVREVFFRPPQEMGDFHPYYPHGLPLLINQPGWEIGEWGVGQTPGSLLHFTHIESPMVNLTDVDELKCYPFPDLAKPERHQHLEAEVAAHHARDLFVVGFMEWTIFEIAWHMRGMDNLFADMAFNEAFAEYLLEQICERRCFMARRYAEAGVDMIRIGDDLGTQRAMLVSPGLYRQWLKPYHARVIAAARAVRPDIHVSYHSDGNCWDMIPDLIEIGVTVLNPVQPECLDIAAVKREFGRDLVFWGGIGTQTTMPFASPEVVYDTVQRTIDTLGPAGYFPCPTHVLEPEVPWDNVLAYLKAVEDYALTPA
jgi:uroporphyrinogen decarboxylase